MGRTKPISPDYVVGITDGEGCFYVNVSKSSAYKSGYQVQLHFHLKLQAKDEALLWKIRTTLQCGNVYFQKEQRKNHSQCYRYTVSGLNDIFEKIIPFFKKYPLQTASKSYSFKQFCRIAQLVKERKHLQSEYIAKIIEIKSKMNHRVSGFA